MANIEVRQRLIKEGNYPRFAGFIFVLYIARKLNVKNAGNYN